MTTSPALPRPALARRLGVSAATVDRWIASGLLRATGARGRQKLYRLADGRRAQKAAGATREIAATIGWLFAQSVEARGHLWRLETEWIHRDAWRSSWRDYVAAVQAVLASWAATSAADLITIVREPARVLPTTFAFPMGTRAIGCAVQEWTRPLLERLAAVSGTWPGPPDRPAPGPRPESITAAKEALVAARTEWAELRTRVKTERGWRRRPELDAARNHTLATAKAVLWGDLPRRMIRLAAQDHDEAAIRAELEAVVGDVLAVLDALSQEPVA